MVITQQSTIAVTAVVAAVLLFGSVGGVAAQELPAGYYGEVTINGESASEFEDVEVSAVVDGTTTDTLAVGGDGNYGGPTTADSKLSVPDLDDIEEGDQVELVVDGANFDSTVAATDEVNFGEDKRVDLSIDVDVDPDDDDDDDDTTTGGTGGQQPAETDDDDDDVVDDDDDVVDDVEDDVVDDVEDDIIDDVIDDEIVPDAEDIPEDVPTVSDVRRDLDATEPNTRSTTPIEDNDPDRPGVNVNPEETESVSEITFNEGAEGNVDISEWQDPPQSVSQSVSGSVTAAVEAQTEENIQAEASVPVVSDIDPDTDEVRGESATVQKTVDADRLDDPSNGVIAHERGDTWALLETTVAETDDGEVTLEAETESFSLFAVAEVDTEETPEEPDDGIGTTGLIGLVVVIALLIAAAVAYRQMNDGGDNNSL